MLLKILSPQYFCTHSRFIKKPGLLWNQSPAVCRPNIGISFQHLPAFAGRYAEIVLNQVCSLL